MTMATPAPRFALAGPPAAHPVVLIHASGWTRTMWQPQVERLADEFRVATLDLPGHGALAHRPFGLDAAVDEVAAALDAATDGRTARRALIVGLSLGGFVAMTFVRRCPERTAGAVLAGCSVTFGRRLGLLARASGHAYNLLWAACGAPWRSRLVRRNAAWCRGGLPATLAQAQIDAGFYLHDWGRALLQVVREDFRPALGAFPGPLLIVNGEGDRPNVAGAERLARAARDARVLVLRGAGHMANLDRPEAFTAAVSGFARSLPWHLPAAVGA